MGQCNNPCYEEESIEQQILLINQSLLKQKNYRMLNLLLTKNFRQTEMPIENFDIIYTEAFNNHALDYNLFDFLTKNFIIVNEITRKKKIDVKNLLLFLFPISTHLHKNNKSIIDDFVDLIRYFTNSAGDQKEIDYVKLVDFYSTFVYLQSITYYKYLNENYPFYIEKGGLIISSRVNYQIITEYANIIVEDISTINSETHKLDRPRSNYVSVEQILEYYKNEKNFELLTQTAILRDDLQTFQQEKREN